ncbi:TetR family transcriptional regulator [Prosthecobacter sp.]|uniref:TetR/AcrR family transcriptional regulator n=1 Tax=Prosthecobacter sp. TaxID=1965333 RepID=UPI003783710C
MSAKNTRDRIVETADRLFYEKGFEYISVGDIADAVEITRGNLTFHFKTRDDVLEAVIERRMGRTRDMLAQWEKEGCTAAERIGSFINILIMNRTKILLHGCPVGTLCTELAKLEHAALTNANRIFSLFRDWLKSQFEQLGCGGESKAHAMHLLAWSQGTATLAQAFRDETFIRAEVSRVQAWLAGLGKQGTRRRKR